MDVESIYEGLHGNKYFSKVEQSHAFHQVPLDEESRRLTTINTMWGLYQFRFLPFGLNVSPGIFQGVKDSILSGIQGVRA